MIWFVLSAAGWAADGSALRQLPTDGQFVVEVGMDNAGIAVDVGKARVAVDLGYGSYIGAHLGGIRELTSKGSWGIDAVGNVGVAALLATPGVAVMGTGELRGGVRDERHRITGALVVPLVVSVDLPPALAVPIGLEAAVAAKAGPLWLGGRAQMGATLWTGGVAAVRTSAGVFVGVRR